MSCFKFRLPKKLFPSKKVCKSFITTLRRHLPESLYKTHRRFRSTNSRSLSYIRHHHKYSDTIFVDRLFAAVPAQPNYKGPATVGVTRHVEMTGGSSSSLASGGGGKSRGKEWKEYLESLPPIRGVDERAEEFITSFRQQMKIEREQSLIDYQEMLARSN